MIGGEDGYEDTVVPRLAAAGADLTKVHFLLGTRDDKGKVQPFSLNDIEPLMRYLIANPNIRAVIIDPISGYVGRAGAKDNNEAEIRAILDPLIEMADERGVMIIAIKHLNKDEGKTVASRVGGSVAYVNAPRVCYLVGKDPTDENRRVMAVFKWNLNTPRPKSIAWTLERVPDDEADTVIRDHCDPTLDDEGRARMKEQLNRVRWSGPCDVEAEDLLSAAAKADRKPPTNEFGRAEEWLRNRLEDGPIESLIAAKEGDEFLGRKWPEIAEGLTADQIEVMRLGRVKWWRENILKKRLGGMSRQRGFRGRWFFELPIVPTPSSSPWVKIAEGTLPTEATTEDHPLTPTSVASVASVASVETLNVQYASKQTTIHSVNTESTESTEATEADVTPDDSVVASVAIETPISYADVDWRAPIDEKAF